MQATRRAVANRTPAILALNQCHVRSPGPDYIFSQPLGESKPNPALTLTPGVVGGTCEGLFSGFVASSCDERLARYSGEGNSFTRMTVRRGAMRGTALFSKNETGT